MHLYMSGTPRNDPYQTVENRMCTHRLFSMHGDYEKAVLRWVRDLRAGIMTAEQYLEAYPKNREYIVERDARRRNEQKNFGRTIDWSTADVLEKVCETLDGKPYPKTILLDSGAFTAWNKGEKTTVEDVLGKYGRFMDAAGDLFDEVWMINLDVIPGERGRDPTAEELSEAVRVSDINFEILTREFGERILPVFHLGESSTRLTECVEQVLGKSNYICVSPRNDLPEGKRVEWSRDTHGEINRKWEGILTHGLATTGNKMVRTVPWYSGDSAAWVQHGGYGMIDIFHGPGYSGGAKSDPHYMNYFVSFEGAIYDLTTEIVLPDGRAVSGEGLGLTEDSSDADKAAAFVAAGVDPDHFPFLGAFINPETGKAVGGHISDEGKHFNTLSNAAQEYVRSRVEALGFPFEIVRWDSRVRNLVCMAEFVEFAEWAKTATRTPAQTTLGDL